MSDSTGRIQNEANLRLVGAVRRGPRLPPDRLAGKDSANEGFLCASGRVMGRRAGQQEMQ